jgi:hypothetical protein
VISAVVIAGAVLGIAGGLAYSARLVHIGNLDALALAEKMAAPDPASALDWPELCVHAVIPQPDEPSLVLLVVDWPARDRRGTLLVHLGSDHQRSLALLARWCAAQASIAPTRDGNGAVQFRRRQTLERAVGILLAEDPCQTAAAGAPVKKSPNS